MPIYADLNMAHRGSILYIALSIAILPFSKAVSPNTNLISTCQTNGWDIRLDITSFGYGVTSSTADDVSLGTTTCKGTMEGRDLVFRYPYEACKTDISISKERVWFTNTLYMVNTSAAVGVVAPPAWNIQVACYMADVQTPRVRYTPLRMSTQHGVPQTSTQPPTVQPATTPDTAPYQHTATYEQSTGDGSGSHTTRKPVVPSVCNVCSGGPCGILPAMEKTQTCTRTEPFCMNSVKKDAQGHTTYVKECAGQHRCERLWWEQTSDDQRCIPFNPAYTGDLECHYCCTTDGCNKDFVPNKATLYKGND
ncbi:uncharacterized protein [Haliotis cracherodii]|uniref:uncharacterized protein n=1 Tax=Haliotis cracherodii TaxID=6455 RepID=UPI0039EC42EA